MSCHSWYWNLPNCTLFCFTWLFIPCCQLHIILRLTYNNYQLHYWPVESWAFHWQLLAKTLYESRLDQPHISVENIDPIIVSFSFLMMNWYSESDCWPVFSTDRSFNAGCVFFSLFACFSVCFWELQCYFDMFVLILLDFLFKCSRYNNYPLPYWPVQS
jgi:hypothetical protein